MNILILYAKDKQEIFNRKSALGSYINCLANLLEDESYNVYLNGVRNNAESIRQVNVSSTGEEGTGKSRLMGLLKWLPSFIKHGLRDFLHFRKLGKFKDELLSSGVKYDSILEFYTLGSDLGLELAERDGSNYTITYDGPIIEEYQFFNGRSPLFLKRVKKRELGSLNRADNIVAYSEPMKSFLGNLGVNTEKVKIHQNVDFTRFDRLEEEKTIPEEGIKMCFIGSFLKWHQVDLLVDVFSSLVTTETIKNIELFLVGDGIERPVIEEKVNGLDEEISSKIHFTGFLDGEELYELKKSVHIGIMPGSNWYGAPNKIFEYGAMKLAVVAPDTPTIVDLFNEKEVSFFKWKSSDDLHKVLLDLIKDQNKIASMSNALNMKIGKKYTEENTKHFYQSLLYNRG